VTTVSDDEAEGEIRLVERRRFAETSLKRLSSAYQLLRRHGRAAQAKRASVAAQGPGLSLVSSVSHVETADDATMDDHSAG
jgi:hypothetical protein